MGLETLALYTPSELPYTSSLMGHLETDDIGIMPTTNKVESLTVATISPSIGLIIVNFNSGGLLQDCIESINSQTRTPDRCMVIDNASQDSSLSCHGLDTSWEVIRLDSNQGFARANNLGFELMSDMDYIVTLNPDAVASPELISQLARRSIEHPGTASFACRMMLDSQTIDGMGDIYHFTGLVWRRNHGRTYATSRKTWSETFSACAGAAMYHVEKFNTAKGFDEEFFCYCEDIDLGFRLQLAGESCVYCPEAEVLHRASSITSNYPGFAVYHGHRNLVWVFVKNLPVGLLLVFLPAHLTMTFVALVWAVIHGNGRTFLKAKLDSLKGLRGMLRKRKAIQNTRKLGELELAKKLDYGFFR